MKVYKKIITAAVTLSSMVSGTAGAEAAGGNTVNITVNTAAERKTISPYIYGVSSEMMDKDVAATGAIVVFVNGFTHWAFMLRSRIYFPTVRSEIISPERCN